MTEKKITAALEILERGPIACLCCKTPMVTGEDGKATPELVDVVNADTGETTQEPKGALRGFTRTGEVCPSCLGFLWHYSDGVAPTVCPSNAAKVAKAIALPGDTLARALMKPCGRKGATCPGCGRAFDAIGGEEDQRRTLETRAKVETSADND